MEGWPNKSESGETECKGTLETPQGSWIWEVEHKQAGRKGPGTLLSKAVASHTGQGCILPPWHNGVTPFKAGVAVA